MKRLSILFVIFIIFSLSISSCLLGGGGSESETATVAALQVEYLSTIQAGVVNTATKPILSTPQSMPATWTPGPPPTWTPGPSPTMRAFNYSPGPYATEQYVNPSNPVVPPPVNQPPAGPPAGATALCNDGTYSDSQTRSGTCSHHGGVNRWLP